MKLRAEVRLLARMLVLPMLDYPLFKLADRITSLPPLPPKKNKTTNNKACISAKFTLAAS